MDDTTAQDLIGRLNDAEKLRFAVWGPKGFSAPWTSFGRGSDFYIGARPIMGSQKISLHASGVCRLSLTDVHYDSLPSKGRYKPLDRVFAKWRRPEIPTVGAVHIVSLRFPSEYLLLPEPKGTHKKPLVFFGEAHPLRAIEVGFFLSRERMPELEARFLNIGHPIHSTDLDDGTVVSIVVRDMPFQRSDLPSQEMLDLAPGRPLVSKEDLEIAGSKENLTMLFWNEPKDGEALIIYEVSGVSLRKRAF
jgi:hypothetical protein